MIGNAPIGSFPVGGKLESLRLVGRVGRSKFVGVQATFTAGIVGDAGVSTWKGVEGDARQVLLALIGSSQFQGVSGTFASGIVGSIGTSVWKGVEADVNYVLEGVPDIVVSRGPCDEVTVFVRNFDGIDVNVYRADNMNLNFQFIDRISVDTMIDDVNCDLNYKYKASFVFEGEVDGSPVSFESRKSVSKYTKHG